MPDGSGGRIGTERTGECIYKMEDGGRICGKREEEMCNNEFD